MNCPNVVSLSIEAMEIADEREAVAQYGSSDSGASLGDIFQAAMKKKEEDKSAFFSFIVRGSEPKSSGLFCGPAFSHWEKVPEGRMRAAAQQGRNESWQLD